jgi:hypothetical protein
VRNRDLENLIANLIANRSMRGRVRRDLALCCDGSTMRGVAFALAAINAQGYADGADETDRADRPKDGTAPRATSDQE